MTKTLSICRACLSLNRFDAARAGAVCGKCKSALPVKGAVTELTADSLKAFVAASPTPVVVDFWAPWCGPCVSFAPTYAAGAMLHAERVAFAKVDTEAHPAASAAFGIRGIPTLIAFAGGREIARQSGAMPAAMLDQWITKEVRS